MCAQATQVLELRDAMGPDIYRELLREEAFRRARRALENVPGVAPGQSRVPTSSVVALRRFGRDRRVLPLDVDARQDPVEPLREVPVAVAEQLHRRGNEHHAHDRRVDEHRDGEAEAEQLQRAVVAEHERREHATP